MNIKTINLNVQRRLNKIRDVITEIDCLKLVPNKMNPADIATRSLSPLLLSNSDLWFFLALGFYIPQTLNGPICKLEIMLPSPVLPIVI